jgi:hypothetical protein
MRRQLQQDGHQTKVRSGLSSAPFDSHRHLRHQNVPIPESSRPSTPVTALSIVHPKFDDPIHFLPLVLLSPTQSMNVELLSPFAAPKALKPKYGGDEIALSLAAQMQVLEAEGEDLRSMADESDEWSMKWDKIGSKCSQNGQPKSCQFAQPILDASKSSDTLQAADDTARGTSCYQTRYSHTIQG